MTTKWLGPLCAVLCALSPAALADPAPARIVPLRVESSLNVQVPLPPGGTSDEQLRQSEEIRKPLYQAAARECALLQDIFKIECRLQSVRVTSNIQSRNSTGDFVSVSGSFSYELFNRPN